MTSFCFIYILEIVHIHLRGSASYSKSNAVRQSKAVSFYDASMICYQAVIAYSTREPYYYLLGHAVELHGSVRTDGIPEMVQN
uniref:Uncharacterized protein n=1 Tax=Rhipicephalus appendiculatus TaxID=34631 RepID=A0A131YFD3_RHIAP